MRAVNRGAIRQLKRAVANQNNVDAMQVLLQRSVHFGHTRLALLRCIQAQKMGISVAPEVLAYCEQVADRMAPEVLYKILQQAGMSRLLASTNSDS